MTLGPARKDIDFSAVTMEEFVDELRKRCAGFILITYTHTEDLCEDDGHLFFKGSQTVIRGLRDNLNDEMSRLFYGSSDPE